ncbi:MAG: DUF1592 domain-containing protein [Akkermansiaceae bacterium]|jgi:hypothetical protein
MSSKWFALVLSLGILPGLRGDVLNVFQSHCIQCHGNEEKIKGKTNLFEIQNLDQLKSHPELLGKIVDAIDFEEMPPEDEPQLEPEARAQLLADLKGMLHESVAANNAYPPTPIRRMNRFQYHNAVTDLFQLNCEVFTLPEKMVRDHRGYFQPASGKMADVVTVGNRPLGKSQMIESRLAGVAAFPQDLRAEHGYDNQADHLSMSPLLMQSFLQLGQSILNSPNFGPKQVGVWKKLFVLDPREKAAEAAVRSRLQELLTKAFRAPVEIKILDRYTRFVMGQLDQGADFTEAMKSVSAAVISSPRFLYLYNRSSDSEGKLDGYELASHLSFFLWGSLPDQILLDLAGSGELLKKEVLGGQLDRMLKDPKVKRFCDSFPAQWLQLDRLVSSVPDLEKFPEFYFSQYRDSMHMMMEPLLLFETILIENQPITQFIDSDFTYRSGHLEEAYGSLGNPDQKRKGEVEIMSFHRVPITDRRTGGVITNAAIMTMTSGPERTQPITRGAWLAGVIFNNPPEPPPADVPALGEKPSAEEEHLTLRERLAMHRERADCRGCHEQIDPLGFALENYNAIGKWRENYENGREVDMEGTLFRKHQFGNVIAFKDAILAEKDRFAKGLAGHLLSFALARELGAADQIALEQIVKATAEEGDRIQSMLKAIVLSDPFLSKHSPKSKPSSK